MFDLKIKIVEFRPKICKNRMLDSRDVRISTRLLLGQRTPRHSPTIKLKPQIEKCFRCLQEYLGCLLHLQDSNFWATGLTVFWSLGKKTSKNKEKKRAHTSCQINRTGDMEGTGRRKTLELTFVVTSNGQTSKNFRSLFCLMHQENKFQTFDFITCGHGTPSGLARTKASYRTPSLDSKTSVTKS